MLYVTEHAITRYKERVKPALDWEQAKAECEALVRMAGDPLNEKPDWLLLGEEEAQFLILSEGIVALVQEENVLTVITRGCASSTRRAIKNEHKRERRAARKRKPVIFSRQAGRPVEPKERWR